MKRYLIPDTRYTFITCLPPQKPCDITFVKNWQKTCTAYSLALLFVPFFLLIALFSCLTLLSNKWTHFTIRRSWRQVTSTSCFYHSLSSCANKVGVTKMFIKNKEIMNKSAVFRLKLSFPFVTKVGVVVSLKPELWLKSGSKYTYSYCTPL